MDIIKTITGSTSYKGYTVQQHENVFDIFKNFLSTIQPSRILEIGTAGGGFTLFLRDVLDDLQLHTTPIRSFDVVETNWYRDLRRQNLEIIIENCFNFAYNELEKPELVVPYIQQAGTTLVLCDGGHKVGEFNALAPHLKVGDYIMAHDYVDTWENFKENFDNKIWNWCEVEEKYIENISKEYNLEHFNKEVFDSVVWVCKVKKV